MQARVQGAHRKFGKIRKVIHRKIKKIRKEIHRKVREFGEAGSPPRPEAAENGVV